MALPKANKSPRGFKCKDKVPIERQAIPVMAITKPKKKLTLKSNFLTKMQLIRPTNKGVVDTIKHTLEAFE